MAVGLVKALGLHFSQVILVGEAAFIKHVLELGRRSGVDWTQLLVHIIVGEEPLAENARKYLEHLIGTDAAYPDDGLIASSMGVAELGLNLFSEVPPMAPLIALRRLLHENAGLRQQVFGTRVCVPSLFTYDPRRIFVEFDAAGRLVVTTLETHLRIPLIRYATGDRGGFLQLPAGIKPQIEAQGISWELLQAIPIVVIQGRGECASTGRMPVYPEEVKEGIYHDHRLAALITANFRLVSGSKEVRIRIQLSPGVLRTEEIEQGFLAAISLYVTAPIKVVCEPYETFGSGMALDYERKFSYLSV
jgi:phenylacetate-CoA ligase